MNTERSYYERNKKEILEKQKEYRKNNPEKMKVLRKAQFRRYYYADPDRAWAKKLRERYGISVEEYNSLFDFQDGRCAICETHQIDLKTRLCVDHCHDTGEVRGLLCHSCNVSVGLMQDNAHRFKRAAEYLESRLQ